MRTIAPCVVFLSLSAMLTGCHEDVVGEPATPSAALPTYAAERSVPDTGQIVLTGEGVGRNHLRLKVRQRVVTYPMGTGLHLRIDPAASARVGAVVFGTPCGSSPATATPTANPGEWHLYRFASAPDCSSCPPLSGPLLTVDVFVGTPGTWPVSLAGSGVGYASYAITGCNGHWTNVREFFGGTITVPPP